MPEELRALPGIGRYTGAALVASIAFDQPVAVVDGNVEAAFLQRVHGKNLSGEKLCGASPEKCSVGSVPAISIRP